MCSAKQILEFYRRATEAGKFSEGSTNPVKGGVRRDRA